MEGSSYVDGDPAPLPGSDAPMFIQWKGTDLCLDLWCPCGADGHFDGYFAYRVECPACGAIYEMGTQVVAKRVERPLDPGTTPVMLELDWQELP